MSETVLLSSVQRHKRRFGGALLLALALIVMAILVNHTSLREQTWLRVLFGISALNFTLRATVPLALGALSGILCERSGIINIGIEGMMLAGAFAGFVAKTSTNHWPLTVSLIFSVAVAVAVGGLMGALHALFSIRFRMDQIISALSSSFWLLEPHPICIIGTPSPKASSPRLRSPGWPRFLSSGPSCSTTRRSPIWR